MIIRILNRKVFNHGKRPFIISTADVWWWTILLTVLLIDLFCRGYVPNVVAFAWAPYICWTALDRTARSHSLNVKLCALGAAWSVETGIHGQLRLEYSVGQLELCHTIVDVKMK
jgi:hypothetical protein